MNFQGSYLQKNKSFWQKSSLSFEPYFLGELPSDQYADICIIGAGIAGLTTAYKLLLAGKSVIIIEKEATVGVHESGLTSAHLSFAMDDGFSSLIHDHGLPKATVFVESHIQAIDEIEEICRKEKINCDFKRVDGYLFLGANDKKDHLLRELESARMIGLENLELLDQTPAGFFKSGCAIRFPRQGQFHALKYLNGLSDAVQRLGGKIYTHTEAQEVVDGRSAYVKAKNGFCVHCNQIVVATNVPFNDRVSMQTKIAAYRSYLIGVRVPKDFCEPMLLWDTEEPYHYVRLVEDESSPNWDILLIGGEDHRVGHEQNPQRRFKKLSDWTEDVLGLDGPIVHRWSGQIIEPFDGPAFIGKNPGSQNIYIVTGDSGHGLTHGTIAGKLISDLIRGLESPWEEIYSPARFNLKNFGNYLFEAAQSTSPYKDWLSPAEVNNVEDIPPGEGAILRKGFKKLAVYRSNENELKVLSAVCTHLGGIVRWNDGEKTWDCPCHGSRFSPEGHVINGPAIQGLGAEEVKEDKPQNPVEELPINPS